MPLRIDGTRVEGDLDLSSAPLVQRTAALASSSPRTIGKNGLCVFQAECGVLVSDAMSLTEPRMIGSPDATNCVIVLVWAKGDTANVAAACHIDGSRRAGSLTGALLQPAYEAWKRHNAAAKSDPAWQVSLVGAFDAVADSDTVGAVVASLSASPHEYDLVHANILQLNCAVASEAACPGHGDGGSGHSCGHSHADGGGDDDEGQALTYPLVMHAAIDVADGSVCVADFSYLGPDAVLRAARVSRARLVGAL